MANDFGTGKSVLILAIVAGCFAILWPNVFYPMITGSYTVYKNEGYSGGCCDVIFDNDINAIRIMSELCEKILFIDSEIPKSSLVQYEPGKLSKDMLEKCQITVLQKCNINITDLIRKNVLGRDYRHNLDNVRNLNASICLREGFGISTSPIGLPRRMRVWGHNMSKHFKQERPPHLHPDKMHPALREKGRAIPQSHVVPKIVQESKPPLPGIRPPLGGPGHVVPPPKVGGGGTMGIVMPMYTIGIVIFFLYTMMKLMFKKHNEVPQYDDFSSDPNFRNEVFDGSPGFSISGSKDGTQNEATRLGWRERDARDLELEMLKERLQETEKAMERIVAKMMTMPHSSNSSKDASSSGVSELSKSDSSDKISSVSEKSDQISSEVDTETEVNRGVKVVGMETTETCESGKWSKPVPARPPTPQNIYIPGKISEQSQVLVTDSTTEAVPDSENAVVLSGKVTLSLIGIQDNDESVEIELDDQAKKELSLAMENAEVTAKETGIKDSASSCEEEITGAEVHSDEGLAEDENFCSNKCVEGNGNKSSKGIKDEDDPDETKTDCTEIQKDQSMYECHDSNKENESVIQNFM